MRRAKLLALALAALTVGFTTGCAATEPPPPLSTAVDTRAAYADVARELDDFHDAAAHADESRYFAHFAPRGVFLGTDATERWDVPGFRAYAHPHFAKGNGWVFHPERRDIEISSDGSTAWFDEALLGEKLGPARGSGVLIRSGQRWLIAQYNLALTIPNERFAEVHALLSGPDATDAKAAYQAAYADATQAVTRGDLGQARHILELLVPGAKTRPNDDQEFWLHNELTWVAWGDGDLARALAEVDAAKATIDHATLSVDATRALRLHELWDRAYLMLERALAAKAQDRRAAMAKADEARAAYTSLAKEAHDDDGLAVLDAFFAARHGDAKAARDAASKVDVDKDSDLQDLYVIALAFDAAKDARAADVRTRICNGREYLMKPLLLAAMKREGHGCGEDAKPGAATPRPN